MDGKKWLIVLLLLIGFKSFGQSYQYTYIDPCTGVPNTVTISQPSGSVTLFYAGQWQVFTASQLQAGGYEAWVASINAAAPPGSNPCAGNAGSVSSSTSASVGTNVTNTVSNISGALSTLGSTTSSSSTGSGLGMSTSSSGGSSSSSSSSGGSSSDDGGGSDDGGDGSSSSSSSSGTSSGSSSSGSSSGSSGSSSGSGDTGSGSTGGNTGGDTGGSSGGGDTGGNSGGNTGGGDTGGGSSGGGSTGGGDTGGSSSGGGATEGGQGTDGGGVTTGDGEGSSSGGAVGDKDIDAESGGQSSDSDDSDGGGGGGGRKKKGPRARKGSLIASGDMVLIRNGSDYKQAGNDNFKINLGMTYANTNQTLAAGALLNYTTGQNEISLTGYGSWKIEQSMIVGSNSFLYNIKQQTWFNTGNFMYAYKQTNYLTILYGTNYSFGKMGEESFQNWAGNVGVFSTFNGYRGISINGMLIGMYSPYTFFYEGQWFKGGFLFVPLSSVDFKVTDTFKLNISTSTVYLMGQGILNFQLMTGGKMLL